MHAARPRPSCVIPAGDLSPYDLVVVAASLGGRAALTAALTALGPNCPVPVLVAQHLAPTGSSVYTELLARQLGDAGPGVAWADDGLEPRPGMVYVARPATHFTVRRAAADGGDTPLACVVTPGPRVNFVRPSADLLFASAAAACGPRVLAVVLSGRLRDGSAGAAAVRAAGGVVIAQAPATCGARGMPEATIACGAAQFVLPPPGGGARHRGARPGPGRAGAVRRGRTARAGRAGRVGATAGGAPAPGAPGRARR